MEAEAEEAQANAETGADEIAEEETAEMETEAEEAQANAETGEREDDITTLYCKNKDEEQYDMDGEERFRVPSEEYEECYGHGGDDMTTYDPYASYPESHFSETDERYMDEQAEMTEATNQKALRELDEFQRLQNEEAEQEAEALRQAEMEAEQEAEAQRQAEMEAEQEAEAQRQAEMEAEQEAEALRQAEMEAEQEAEAQRQTEMEAEQEAEAQRQTEMEKELEKKQEKYKDLDLEYKQIKNDIEISRTSEERAYWEKRAEEIWQERDRVGGEIEDYRRNK